MNKTRVVMTLRPDLLYPKVDPRVYKEAKSLVRHGYDVNVVCWSKAGDNLPDYEEHENIAPG